MLSYLSPRRAPIIHTNLTLPGHTQPRHSGRSVGRRLVVVVVVAFEASTAGAPGLRSRLAAASERRAITPSDDERWVGRRLCNACCKPNSDLTSPQKPSHRPSGPDSGRDSIKAGSQLGLIATRFRAPSVPSHRHPTGVRCTSTTGSTHHYPPPHHHQSPYSSSSRFRNQ